MKARITTPSRLALLTLLACGILLPCAAQENSASKPIELETLKASVGVWDAAVEIWPEGPESTSIKFKGVENIRAFGEYWIASDFESEFQGQPTGVHSIVGYSIEKRKMLGLFSLFSSNGE